MTRSNETSRADGERKSLQASCGDDKCVLPGAKPENKDAGIRQLEFFSAPRIHYSIFHLEGGAPRLRAAPPPPPQPHFTFLSTRAAIVGAAKLFAHIHPSLARRQNTILGANERGNSRWRARKLKEWLAYTASRVVCTHTLKKCASHTQS